MKRIGLISLIALGAFAALFLTLWVGLFYTPPGRQLLEEIIERELGDALNSEADIGALAGAPPGHLVAIDITLANEQGAPWLTLERLEVRWRPRALLRNRIFIDEATLANARLVAEPPEGDEPDGEDARQIKILDNLPRIEIAALTIDDFRAPVTGVRQGLDATGSIRLDGPDIAILLNAESDARADIAAIAFAKSPDTGWFTLDASVVADPGGLIASLLDLQGATELYASGDSPVNDAVITVEGNVGHYGSVSAEISSSFDDFDGADINASMIPGKRFEGVEELAGAITISARYDASDGGGALTMKGLSTIFAEIDGHVDWRAPRGFVERLNLDLNAVLAEAYQPSVQEIAGRNLNIKGALDWGRNDYKLDVVIAGPLASLTLNNGRTDLRNVLAGPARLEALAREDGDIWLRNGLTLETQLTVNFDDAVRLGKAHATTGDGSRFSGEAAYGLDDDALDVRGDISLTPAFSKLLLAGATPQGDITGDVELIGPSDLFTLKTALETPALAFRDGALPPMNITAALSGLPRLPTGAISARARNDAPRRLNAQLRSSEDGTIRLSALSYSGRGFSLDGTAQIDPSRQTVMLDIAYEGAAGAEPWPGIDATGAVNAKGVLSRDGALNRMKASADAFAVNDIAVSGLRFAAEGPPGAVTVEVEAAQLAAAGRGILTNLNAAGVANASGPPTLLLSRFEAIIRDSQAKLTEPARFHFSDGVGIDNLRLAWGANGTISIDGAFSPARWRTDAQLTNVTIPGADGQITGRLSLDTDEATPGSGTFTLRSLLLNREAAAVSARAVWDGETLLLTEIEEREDLDMRLNLPLRLARKPQLNLDTSGALSGRVRYDGDMQAITAYLPPVLQSIEGALSANFTFGGTLAAPDIAGRANLKDGAYTEIESGFSLVGIHAEAEAAYGAGVSKVTLTGGARGAEQQRADTILFDGDMTFGRNAMLNLAVTLDNASLSAHPVNQVRANGSVKIAGPLNALKAHGDISVTELDAEIISPESTGLVEIEVVSLEDGGAAAADLTKPQSRDGLEFDIHISADDRIFIRGRGMESEWSADVRAVNGREEPIVLGQMSLRRGWIDFSGRRFELSRGSIEFDRLAPNNPRLDIRAELNAGDGVTAAIVLSGRADDPDIELTSTPVMPSEDVMSLILFGKPAQNLSPLESLQTAQALASLGGIGPFGGGGGVTSKLRRAVGLDLLNVDIDPESGGGSLTVGKYVAEGFFVSASQDAQGRSGSVSVKYEITDNITIETELEQEGDQTVSANWKKDF